MTIRRRDRGLSGDDMGCDGSWDMTDDLLERLREVPGAMRFSTLWRTFRASGWSAARCATRCSGASRGTSISWWRATRRPPRGCWARSRSSTSASARRPRPARSTSPQARRERYERPGALPEVELGAPIAEDLARRDFSVNAIAVRLADGELQAVPGGLEDLAARRLRVLHERSFLDDPTRLLRLVRYAARLRFQMEEETRAWAFAAVEGGALATVTAARLGAELRLLAGEPMPGAMCGLEAFGLGPELLPGFAVDPDLVERAQRLTPHDARADLVALAACLLDASAPALAARLDAFEFTARERDTVVAAATRARAIAPVLGGTEGGSAIWTLLRREAPETVALAGALGAPEAARLWLEQLRHRKLAITGDDLLAEGLEGPAIGRALDAATAAMLDGEAEGREAQLAAALAAPPE